LELGAALRIVGPEVGDALLDLRLLLRGGLLYLLLP